VGRPQIRQHVLAILARMAPGVDPALIAEADSLRTVLVADSMDMLNFVTALHDELGVDVPEGDYPLIDTLDGCVDYLAAAVIRRGCSAH
jgi:acyl carrier protein